MFIGPFLGVLRYDHPEFKDNNTYTKAFNEAITACKNGVGCGKDGFDKALKEVESELQKVSASLGDIKNVLEKVKNISGIKSNQNSLNAFAGKVKDYFTEVLEKVEKDASFTGLALTAKQQISTLKSNLATLLTNVGNQKGELPINVGEGPLGKQTSGLKEHIDKIYAGGSGTLTELRKAFPDFSKKPVAFALSAAAYNGANLFVTVLQTDYTSYYPSTATWQSDSDNPQKCAKIFLACLPLVFNGLSYFYWKCSDQNGWSDMTLGSPEPKAFMGFTSIGANRVKSGRKGAEVVTNAFQNFKEFKTAANGSSTSYTDFLKKFRGNCLQKWQTSHSANESNFLSGLYLCSTSYFRHQHQKKAATARPPSSIREMLYWLMGMTATPQFGDLLGHIHNVVGSDFKVAVSGSSKTGETLSPDQVTSYILSTCYTAPSVLNTIQGSLAFKTLQDEPWLYDLYSNSAFPFKYPSSGAALFYALSDYTYALQFQLGLLYQQCSQLYVNTFGCSKPEHQNSDKFSEHKSGDCQHNGCGTANNRPSPLQAFLSDNLKGFSRGHPSGHSAQLATFRVPVPYADGFRKSS
ncbi:variant erythrocyte surface antigen-1 family protein [Babesia caballi]|uniref:Variant erythrocyte surface antigen-1 family protein n=1 Tax=Babesia caballi TaxID=5871 RepID=A0AAV4LU68_BABCB|nr:variant erythrocyte surface antigen-1 family protein [Babesia caballi]